MSQNRKSLDLIDAESGIGGLLLRPLSARHLAPTLPEEEGWVKRDLLMDFQGRSRKPQMELARRLNIEKYPSPGGGCLLTEKAFSKRLKDLFSHRTDNGDKRNRASQAGETLQNFRQHKIVVGVEIERKMRRYVLFRASETSSYHGISVPGPSVLAPGGISDTSLDLAAAITAAYSDAGDNREADIKVAGRGEDKVLRVGLRDKEEFRCYMI